MPHSSASLEAFLFYLGAILDNSVIYEMLRDYIWACDVVMWHWSVGFLFWQLSIDMNIVNVINLIYYMAAIVCLLWCTVFVYKS